MRGDKKTRLIAGLASFLTLPGMLAAAIDGRILSELGTPIEHARVEAGEGGEVVYSDSRGDFRLESVDPPADVFVTHPRFVTGHLFFGPGRVVLSPV